MSFEDSGGFFLGAWQLGMDLKPRLVERLSAYIPGLKDTLGRQSSSPGEKN